MKIVIDVQCCQTEAQSRGIGRYSLALAKELVRIGHEHDFMFLLNRKYLDRSEKVACEIESLGQLGNIVYFDYPEVQHEWRARGVRERIANVLRNDRIETVSPDIYHVSSLFEGESVYGRAPAFTDWPKPPIIRSATVYDFVPLLYPETYLKDWQVKLWYQRTVAVARHLDVGLTISDATKKDAERLLGIAPSKLVNISGDVDAVFGVLPASKRAGAIWKRLKNTPFLLYVGGPDARKNLHGTLEAFAIANRTFRSKYKLVIVCGLDEDVGLKLRKRIGELGISQQTVVTGHVPDAELAELYNACQLFIFPSLYEGLGLPVIEAMRCGAPVLVGDNSSLREIVIDEQFRFDAADPNDIARAMTWALTTKGIPEQMRAYSKQQSKGFSWTASAQRTLDVWEQAYAERTGRTMRSAIPARIAMFTPLPPAMTGIADYCAEFIPALSKHASFELFVEDVSSPTVRFDNVPISQHAEFPGRADEFDAIVYQIGNSPYHHYMLPYVDRHPGVVVLHDACLGHLSHDPGNPGDFIRQTIRDEGAIARLIVSQTDDLASGARALIDKLTCSATHVHRSIGVIVHSQYARRLLHADSNPAAAPEIVVLPQHRAKIPTERRLDKATAREKLGLPADSFIVGTFGHVSPTKGVLELIEGFKTSRIGGSGAASLVFVGELEGGPSGVTPFARRTLGAIAERSDVTITGYVDQETYDLYLCAIDMGIQLRSLSRGETSGAMLNLLLNGVPFAHNRLGASAEIPEAAAFGLESYEPLVVAAAIDKIASDTTARRQYSEAALAFARTTLGTDRLASAFVRTVLSLSERARTCGPQVVSDAVADVLRDEETTRELIDEISTAYVTQERCEERPRLLVDVTHIRDGDLQTGVQRVVRELTRAAYGSDDGLRRPQTFAFTEDNIIFADDFAQRCGARLPVEDPDARSGPLDLRPFDRMLLADGTWHLTSWMEAPLDRLNALSGSAFALVHDILPLQHPHLFHDHVVVSLTAWLSLMLAKGAGLICTSKTAADDLIEYARAKKLPVRPGLRMGVVPLGSNVPLTADQTQPLGQPLAESLAGHRLFLVVGTIEPRKGHDYVLDAFEKLWASNVDVTLAFVGRRGWNVESLLQRIDAHPERGKRFLDLGFVSDADLTDLYQKADATIMASIAEGFGLPIYEAARFGTPLILSDLAVFKELGGTHARYFAAGSAKALASTVRKAVDSPAFLVRSDSIVPPTWETCAKGVFDFMNGRDTYFRFDAEA